MNKPDTCELCTSTKNVWLIDKVVSRSGEVLAYLYECRNHTGMFNRFLTHIKDDLEERDE